MNQKKKKFGRFLLFGLLMLLTTGCVGATMIASPTRVYAAGNSYIYTIANTESHTHTPVAYFDSSKSNVITSSVYKNTGIQVYTANNNGSSSTGSSIKLDSRTFYVDFTGANALYSPSSVYQNVIYTSAYSFEIQSTSGSVYWYARMTGTMDSDNDIYTATYNINGTSNTVTDNTGSCLNSFSPSVFGKKLVTLYGTDYVIKITRTYVWLEYDGSNFKTMVEYQSNSSLQATLLIDVTTPSLQAVGVETGKTITSGSYVNERVTFTASDTNFKYIYYKKPGNSYFNSTASTTYTTTATYGWWTIYAVDSVGNKTSEFTFYLDEGYPIGTLSSNGTTISSGSYISSSFSYSATDSFSGVKEIYYKSPVSNSYQTYASGTIIPSNAGDGWYYFYAVDYAGNQSPTMSVYLETASPIVEFYRNGSLAYSVPITGSGTYDTGLYLNTTDIMKLKYSSSSGTVTSTLALNTNISLADFTTPTQQVSFTTATGIKASYIFHLVDEKPYITIDSTRYEDGSTIYLTEDKLVSWFDDADITDEGETGAKVVSDGNVILNDFYKYSGYSGRVLSTSENSESVYYITLNDRAGNVSNFTIYVDKNPVSATWYSNGNIVENGGYTNKPVYLDIDESNVTATYSKNGSEYVTYTSGQEFTEEGTYNVVIIDIASNKSTYTINIDYTAPTGSLYANYNEVSSGSVVNTPIYFTWDGDATCTVNGSSYNKNTVLTEEGTYKFILTDKAGNISSYTIVIDLTAPSFNQNELKNDTDYKVSKYYIDTFDGKTYSFKSYDEALEFAIKLEMEKYVTTLELDNIADFTQTHLVASNDSLENTADEVRVGTYWRYKSKANPAIELYYFDEELLHDVLASYAKSYVSKVTYLQNGTTPDYGDIDNSMYDNIFSNGEIEAPVANNFIFYDNDVVSIIAENISTKEKFNVSFGIELGKQITTSGLYQITETDEAGNNSTYYVYLDFDSPELKVNAEIFGSETTSEITITKDSLSSISAYYYKSFNISEVIDLDKWSVVAITNNGSTSYYTYEDLIPILNVGGKYYIEVYDRCGNSYSFTVYIVGNEAEVTFTNNNDDTAFDIDITLEQDFDTLVSLEIYKDGVKLDGVSTDPLHYTFSKDGYYTVVMKDNFGRIIQKEYDFNKALPTGTLIGVINGNRTNTDTTFTYDSSKYFAEIYKNGSLIETDYDGKINIIANDENSGNYEFKLVRNDDLDNYNTYSFTLDTIAPTINISGTTNGGTTNGDVIISWSDTDVTKSTFTKGDEIFNFDNNQSFTEEGTYKVTVSDDLGNTSTIAFTIDKSLDYEVTSTSQGILEGGDTTSGSFTVMNNETGLNITVTKNGESYEFDFGDVISEEGTYVFRITDNYGNSTSFTITIDKSVSYEINVADGSISNDDVVIIGGEKINVVVLKDGKSYDYTLGDSLTEEGIYKVILNDAYGNVKELNFIIVKSAKTSINYELGSDVEITTITRDGEIVEITGNNLNFTEDGIYQITVTQDGKEYTFELTLDTTAPEISLNGIEDGGKGNVTVTIDNPTEEGTVEVYKDGELLDYNLGEELKDYGEYKVVVTDNLGNSRTYTFTLEYQMNVWAIVLIGIGAISLIGLVTLIIMKKKGPFKNKK